MHMKDNFACKFLFPFFSMQFSLQRPNERVVLPDFWRHACPLALSLDDHDIAFLSHSTKRTNIKLNSHTACTMSKKNVSQMDPNSKLTNLN